MRHVLRDAALAVALFVVGTPRAESARAPYDVRSGVYESTVMGGTTVVYFDDFGRRQAKYSTTRFGGEASHSLELVLADGTTYSIDLDARRGTKTRLAPEAAQAIGAVLAPEPTRGGGARALEARTYLGRPCKGIEAEAMGMRTRAWTWKGILLHSEVSGAAGGEPVVVEVTRLALEPVPPERFRVPAGIEIQDVSARAGAR
jgi:hypothetical protein